MVGQDGPLVQLVGLSAVQIAADFAGIPGLAPAIDLLAQVVDLCNNVSVNREAAKQLGSRCHDLLLEIKKANAQEIPNSKLNDAVQQVIDCLGIIRSKMDKWARLSWFKAFVKQNDIKADITQCHTAIDDCFTKFQFQAEIGNHRWQMEFTANFQKDISNLTQRLSRFESKQIARDAKSDESRLEVMSALQEINRKIPESHTSARLSHHLVVLQQEFGELLPDMNLQPNEIQRISKSPVAGSSLIDIYEGIFLGNIKVVIKELRTATVNERILRRFEREVKIWNQVWKVDRGKHILPFYGYCLNDGPRPYTVSPWQQNGTAIEYVKIHDEGIDYTKLLRGIAQGVQILHTITPPIAHGDLKGENIMISDSGTPLIANFGLSKIIEDVSAEVTHSKGLEDSYRWFAPEVFSDKAMITISSDIYSLGMTILELLTHKRPFSEIKKNLTVAKWIEEGNRPNRPVEPSVINRGLNDAIWDLLIQCWSPEPTERPSVSIVLSQLN